MRRALRAAGGDPAQIDAHHLLCGLLGDRRSRVAKAIAEVGADLDQLREAAAALCGDESAEAAPDLMPPHLVSVEAMVAELPALWRRFSSNAFSAMWRAEQEARRRGSEIMGTDHLLLGLLSQRLGAAAQVLARLDLSYEQVDQLTDTSREPLPGDAPLSFSPGAKQVLTAAMREAQTINPAFGIPAYIGTEHLLLGILDDPEGQALRLLTALDVDPQAIRREVVAQLQAAQSAPQVPILTHETTTPTTSDRSTRPRPFTSDRLPAPVGPYSHAVRCGDLLFVSGIGPMDPATGKVIKRGFERQVRQTLDNIAALLEDAGTSLANVVKTTVYVTDLSKFPKLNAIYAEYFAKQPPARTTLQAAALPLGIAVEIDVIAYLPSK
jgi:2-iminobutanoate/2-iminopropanoate deaminase